MQTVMTTNNAFDSVLLVDDNNNVLSAWEADASTIASYLATGAAADEWETGSFPPGSQAVGEETLRSIASYGTECGRNGIIADRERREFWAISE